MDTFEEELRIASDDLPSCTTDLDESVRQQFYEQERLEDEPVIKRFRQLKATVGNLR